MNSEYFLSSLYLSTVKFFVPFCIDLRGFSTKLAMDLLNGEYEDSYLDFDYTPGCEDFTLVQMLVDLTPEEFDIFFDGLDDNGTTK